jgi:hypothetical protein
MLDAIDQDESLDDGEEDAPPPPPPLPPRPPPVLPPPLPPRAMRRRPQMPSDAEGLIEDFGLDAVLRVNPMPRLREFVITVADYGDARVQLSESR